MSDVDCTSKDRSQNVLHGPHSYRRKFCCHCSV